MESSRVTLTSNEITGLRLSKLQIERTDHMENAAKQDTVSNSELIEPLEVDEDTAIFRTGRDMFLSSVVGTIGQSFSTWEGFGLLFEWCQEQSWWGGFIHHHGKLLCDCGCNDGRLDIRFIDPDLFASRVYQFINRMTRHHSNIRPNL